MKITTAKSSLALAKTVRWTCQIWIVKRAMSLIELIILTFTIIMLVKRKFETRRAENASLCFDEFIESFTKKLKISTTQYKPCIRDINFVPF